MLACALGTFRSVCNLVVYFLDCVPISFPSTPDCTPTSFSPDTRLDPSSRLDGDGLSFPCGSRCPASSWIARASVLAMPVLHSLIFIPSLVFVAVLNPGLYTRQTPFHHVPFPLNVSPTLQTLIRQSHPSSFPPVVSCHAGLIASF